jgi:hypothetical protein
MKLQKKLQRDILHLLFERVEERQIIDKTIK